MSKIVITFEDFPLMNKVRVKAEPSYETMMKMLTSGNNLSPAHRYAMLALATLRSYSKTERRSPNGDLITPTRVGKA